MNKIYVIIGSMIYVAVLLIAVTQFSWSVIATLVLAPLILITLSARALFVLMPLVLLHSGLFIPGIPGNFQFYQALAIIYIALRIVDVAFTKGLSRERARFDNTCALFLIGWVIMLMVVRGAGIRLLGSSQFGGATYLQVIVSLAFYVLTSDVTIAPKQLRRAGIWMGLLAILPLVANGVFELSGGRIWQQMYFFRLGGAAIHGLMDERTGGSLRFSFMASGAAFLWIGVFYGKDKGPLGLSKIIWWPIAGACALLSGFRSTGVATFGFFFLYGFMTARNKMRFAMVCVILGALGYVVLLYTVTYMPHPVQRVLTDIPGLEVEWRVKIHALSTMMWRQEVWRLAMGDLPQNWLIGRGITFDPGTMPMVGWTKGDYVAYLSGSFHHATLELLILYGLPALLATVGLYLVALHKGRQALFSKAGLGNNPMLRHWALCLWIYVLVRTVLAFTIGVSTELLITLPAYMALFNVIRNSAREQEKHNEIRRRADQLE